MALHQLIEGLNKNKHTQNIGLGSLDDMGFTEAEKIFIETYRPEKSFIIYGSLAPNAPNHHIVEHIKGTWQAGIVKGQLEEKGWGVDFGYLGFKHVSGEEQKEIKAFILHSDELVDNWQLLDEFEGDGYRRLLALFELKNGQIGVGNIYAINE